MKKLINQKSITSKLELLEKIIKKPTEYINNSDVLNALASQSSLAKFADEKLKITGCSLNTFKSNAEKIVPGGFSAFDRQRINALEKLTTKRKTEKNKPSIGTRQHYINKTKQLEMQVNSLQKDNILLSVLICNLRASLKTMAFSSINRKVEYQRLNESITAKLSLLNFQTENEVMEIPKELANDVLNLINKHKKSKSSES